MTSGLRRTGPESRGGTTDSFAPPGLARRPDGMIQTLPPASAHAAGAHHTGNPPRRPGVRHPLGPRRRAGQGVPRGRPRLGVPAGQRPARLADRRRAPAGCRPAPPAASCRRDREVVVGADPVGAQHMPPDRSDPAFPAHPRSPLQPDTESRSPRRATKALSQMNIPDGETSVEIPDRLIQFFPMTHGRHQ